MSISFYVEYYGRALLKDDSSFSTGISIGLAHTRDRHGTPFPALWKLSLFCCAIRVFNSCGSLLNAMCLVMVAALLGCSDSTETFAPSGFQILGSQQKTEHILHDDVPNDRKLKTSFEVLNNSKHSRKLVLLAKNCTCTNVLVENVSVDSSSAIEFQPNEQKTLCLESKLPLHDRYIAASAVFSDRSMRGKVPVCPTAGHCRYEVGSRRTFNWLEWF